MNMKWNAWQCWIEGAWDSIGTLLSSGYPMSGHEWVDQEEHRNCRVIVSRCERCGKQDISWSRILVGQPDNDKDI